MFNSTGIAAICVFAAFTATRTSVSNGSFEATTVTPGAGITVCAGSGAIVDWAISDCIDLIEGHWVASDGTKSLDLNADSPGSIGQTLITTVGTVYRVRFDMAGNIHGGPAVKALRVSAAGEQQDYFFDITGRTSLDMGWTEHVFEFTATSTPETLVFQSIIGGSYGPALDNVRVELATGGSQDDPILPDADDICDLCRRSAAFTCFSFCGVPSGGWFDPPAAYGYEFHIDAPSYFTGVLDFPTGFANPFVVTTDGTSLGSFGPGDSVAFGPGVTSFSVTGISPHVDPEDPRAFPIKLAFDTPMASFSMTPLPEQVCGAKRSAIGCLPGISFSGVPSVTGADDFFVTANDVNADTDGFLVWGLERRRSAGPGFPRSAGASPLGGNLCIRDARPTMVQNAGGTAGQCDGAFSYHLTHATMDAWGFLAGSEFFAQYLFRDPDAVGMLGHTEVLRFVIQL